MSEPFNYEESQLARVAPEGADDFAIAVRSSAGETKWMTVRPATFGVIRAAMVEQGTRAALGCDMYEDCTADVSHIDDGGYLYCAAHGVQRRAGGRRCRKIRPNELRRLGRGLTIKY